MSALIETKDLKKYFKVSNGYLHAVDGVNIAIDEGKTLGVVGESGCGKSTLGRAVLRLHEPTSGEIYYKGENIMAYDKAKMRELRREMQIIFQDPYSSINPRMSVQEIIAEPLIINKMFKTRAEVFDRVAELMDTVGLAERLSGAYPHELDGGRRQRIGVARALSLNPKFIVCDEPVSALDVSIQAQILNLLMDLQDELGLTYMFITHDLSVVKHISTEIAVMYLGMCIERAPSKELFKNPKHPYTRALLSAIPIPNVEMRNKKIEVIKGEVTSPVNPKPGCRFAPRCPHATEACTAETPEFREISPGHFCACPFAQ
ncbi:MAG TPA: ATP-binding cassette domain-containing protein [Candidatus Ventrousia excrementavium]|uniref:ATP-binding cassette domain-containing protein n=1 Tax=Candidatus Ventrousia excrementavium TaxID=2840961 RepID=A0A9D1S220_9CLOT|nr:ATP-binding cassette domain-containing protein [Candidatus Ventrousia excrementavium]